MYYGARYYDPWVGRFLSQDPDIVGSAAGVTFHRIGFDPQQFNSYSYVANRPTIATDPTGATLISYHKNRSGYTIHYSGSSLVRSGITHVDGVKIGSESGGLRGGNGDSDSAAEAATGSSQTYWPPRETP